MIAMKSNFIARKTAQLRRSFWLALALMVTAIPALANDSTAQLGAGGLELTVNSGITMQSEDLRLSVKGVTVTYQFQNETKSDITTLVAFPMPKLSGNDEDFMVGIPLENSPVDFMGFNVEVDGKKISTQVEQRASILGLDITAQLKADGIPINPFTHTGAREALDKLPKDRQNFYVQHGLAEWSDGHAGSVSWDVSTTYYWLQTFPAGKTIVVKHSYQPIVGSFFITEDTLNDTAQATDLTKTFCIDKSTDQGLRKAIAQRKAKTPDNTLLYASRLDYVLTTGANWSGPIKSFSLTIDKPSADHIMSLCFAGKLQKTGPARFEFKAQDFTPTRDLAILFVTGNTDPQ